jgi:hypothetical protein
MARSASMSVRDKWHPINWQALGRLKENWDSYGAKPLDKAVIAKAREVWIRVMVYGERWHAVPMSDGGVQLELHEGGWDIEIQINKATPSNGEGY